ncbi:helix-turn-helix domain-containing protein [Halobacillus shinanisalinarum]|uniref:Helix-turn-helix domain-containing protein n=1 Tax=Halobacillus shinanisalinarum TaxID=2932258 RepID=A0ABY4H359_9BACI|nr:metalloregulator ArsR/SmtB family transcription factor [Halobacillus shinanisalinarum]UOQ94794.1 helix-turn-helix domain-containing protein [Halobacillus shinanisalinarum]
MEHIDFFKALSNETRLEILRWLKEPKKHFDNPPGKGPENIDEKGGVCVGVIQKKAQLSQSTTSQYLSMMQKAGLLKAERKGKWTYYRRNEKMIQDVSEYLKEEL